MLTVQLRGFVLALVISGSIFATSCATNAKSDSTKIADLQAELVLQHELLTETRAELQATMEKLKPLLALLDAVESGDVFSELSGPLAAKDVGDQQQPADGKDASAGDEVIDGITEIGPNHHTITRKRFDATLSDPGWVRGARVVPSVKDGKNNGFKLYAIRPNSIFALLGLMNGDTIQRVDGMELNSPDSALEAMVKVRKARSFEIEISRRGKPVLLRFDVE